MMRPSLFRREVYARLVVLALAGQDFLKQSTTRLHNIADMLVIKESALCYVGHGIPTDLFGPFVTACFTSESREATGEAIYAVLFDSAPTCPFSTVS